MNVGAFLANSRLSGNYMIQVELRDDKTDKLITIVHMHAPPMNGEMLWLKPERDHSAYKVESVAHWVSDQTEYHRVCVYVSVV